MTVSRWAKALVEDDGTPLLDVKLGDFGLSRTLKAGELARSTTGLLLGGGMAPLAGRFLRIPTRFPLRFRVVEWKLRTDGPAG